MSAPPPLPRVLVTRPADQAAQWVERFADRGIEAVALPLMAIEPPAEPEARAAVHAAWGELDRRALVVFVSPNAVAQFFAQRPAACRWPAGAQAGSPGPGTSAALRAAGVPDAAIVEPPPDGGRYDSEALWAVLAAQRRDWQGASTLIVRGGDGDDESTRGTGREWLADTLRAAGAQVDYLRAYRRAAPRFGAAERAAWQQAVDAPEAHCWLFSSSEAVAQLDTLSGASLPAGNWAVASALATHPRIGDSARAAGFGRVLDATPTLDAIVAALRSASWGRR